MKHLSIFPILLSLCLIFSCEAEIEVAPDQGASKAPKFNFLVRQLEDEEKEEPEAGESSEAVNDTIRAELYIRQLDFTDEEEKYKLIVTLPSNFDGLVHYKEATYRSGDWIEILYKDLVEHATVIKMTQRKKVAGQYSINLVCSDSEGGSKSASLAVTVKE